MIAGLARAAILASVAVPAMADGAVWHPEGSGFAAIASGHDLDADFEHLVLKHKGDGQSIAAEIAARGASCGDVTSLDRFSCVYLFCKGNTLQQLVWNIPEDVPSRPSTPLHTYVDYGFTNTQACKNREQLGVRQRDLVFGRKWQGEQK